MPNLGEVIDRVMDLQYTGGTENHKRVITLTTDSMDCSAFGPVAELLNMRGISLRMLGHYDAASVNYEAALAFGKPETEVCRAYVNLADIERVAKSRFDSAHQLLDKAEEHAKPDSLERVIILNQRALVFTAQQAKDSRFIDDVIKSYDEARRICESKLDLINHRESRKRCADILSGLAYIYQQKYPALCTGYYQSVRLYRVAYIYQQKYSELALQLGKTALGHYEAVKDLRGQFNTLCNLGRAHRDRNDPEQAVTYLEKAWRMAQAEKEPRAMAAVALDLAESYYAKGDRYNGDCYWGTFNDTPQQKALTPHDIALMQKQIELVREFYNKP